MTTKAKKTITIGLNPRSLPLVAQVVDQGHRRAGRYVQYCSNLLKRGETPTKGDLQAALAEYAERVKAYGRAHGATRVDVSRASDDEAVARLLAEAQAQSKALPVRPMLPVAFVEHLIDVLAGRSRRGRKQAPKSLPQMAAIRDTYLKRRRLYEKLAKAEDPRLGLTRTERAKRDVVTRAVAATAKTHKTSIPTVRRVLHDLGISIKKSRNS